MAVRSSPYKRDEIIKLLEAAGWQARQAGTHSVISKPGHKTITLTDPVHRNGIAEVQRELGIHVLEVLPRHKGKKPSRAELIKRILMAKRMLHTGLDSAYIMNKCGLSPLQKKGIGIKDIREKPAEELVDTVYQERVKKKGVTIRRLPPVAAAETFAPTKGDDIIALLDLMGPIARNLEMITRTDRLSLLGGYLEMLRLNLADLHALKPHLEQSLEIINRMISRLEKVG